MIIKTYQQAIEYLETFIKPVVFARIRPEDAKLKDPLDRMRKLLELIGNPQNRFKSVLVGGTSGKGSTAYFISHILKTAGYKTGLTISPHLQKINERVQINDTQILDEEFVSFLGKVIPAIEKMQKINDEPSYFEILIAIAFLYFKDQKVDIAVVEVGFGGRYDATNVLNPLIAVLTNVSLDHTDILGKTVEKIAREKIGIVKRASKDGAEIANKIFLLRNSLRLKQPCCKNFISSPHANSVVITGIAQKSVVKIVEERCKEVGAKLYRLGKDFNYEVKKESIDETIFDLTFNADRSKKLNDLRLSAIGRYQVENACLAIETVLELQEFGFKISEQNIRTALSTSFFPGRFEIINFARGPASIFPPANARLGLAVSRCERLRVAVSPSNRVTPSLSKSFDTLGTRDTRGTLVLDGAHNLAKMKAFLSSLKKVYPDQKKLFIVAFKDDKDAKGMLKEILKVANAIIVTEFHKKIEVQGHGAMKRSKIKDQISLLRQGFVGQAKIKKNIKIHYAQNSKEALEKAMEISRRLPRPDRIGTRNDKKIPLVVITGSLYLVGEIRSLIFT